MVVQVEVFSMLDELNTFGLVIAIITHIVHIYIEMEPFLEIYVRLFESKFQNECRIRAY